MSGGAFLQFQMDQVGWQDTQFAGHHTGITPRPKQVVVVNNTVDILGHMTQVFWLL